jgi:hypothetical protein
LDSDISLSPTQTVEAFEPQSLNLKPGEKVMKNHCEEENETQPLPDLPVSNEQAETTVGGTGFNAYDHGFIGGVRVAN